MDKTIERKIAKIVKSELDSKNYEDTAWLKAFREAGGDDKQARASYVEIRTADLNDEFYEESNRLEEEKLKKEEKKRNKEDRILRARELKEQRRDEKRYKKEYQPTSKSRKTTNDTLNLNLKEKVRYFLNGYYSLSHSFWFVGVLMQMIVATPFLYFFITGVDDVSDFTAFILVAYAIFLYAFNIGVIIGQWRSAGFYIEENKPPFWGYVVRVLNVFTALGLVVQFFKLFSN